MNELKEMTEKIEIDPEDVVFSPLTDAKIEGLVFNGEFFFKDGESGQTITALKARIKELDERVDMYATTNGNLMEEKLRDTQTITELLDWQKEAVVVLATIGRETTDKFWMWARSLIKQAEEK